MHLTLDSQSQAEASLLHVSARQWGIDAKDPASSPTGMPRPAVEIDVQTAFDRWFSQYLRLRKDGGESVRRSMMKDVLPHIGHQALASLQKDDLTRVLHQVIGRGSPRQAGCVLADMRQLLRWGLREGLIDNDPSAGLNKIAFSGDTAVRSRVLSVEEVAELAGKVQFSGLAEPIRKAIWLMLSTGVRIGEVANARWQDIDLHQGVWRIPEHLSHSGRLHVVPLSAFAISHLMSSDGQRSSPVWVFPSRDDAQPLSPKALGKQIRDRQRGVRIRGRSSETTQLLLSGGAWTPLDLRRTAASLMAKLAVRSETISACLDQSNHKIDETGSPAVDREACRTAFAQLGQYLEQLARTGFTRSQGKAETPHPSPGMNS